MSFDEAMLSSVNVLKAVVTSGSFTRASEVLDMTQSGVSRAIARLESRLGIRLIERSPRRLRLTDAGRDFYETVFPLLDALDDAAHHAETRAQTVQGRLRVNIDPLFSGMILAPRLGHFLNAHPGLHLDIFTSDAMPDLISSAVDLAIRFGQPTE